MSWPTISTRFLMKKEAERKEMRIKNWKKLKFIYQSQNLSKSTIKDYKLEAIKPVF